jgi:hypothetical protein
MLVALANKNIKDCTDGSSNVMIVGEHSNFIFESLGGPKTRQVSGTHGIMMGGSHLTTVEASGGGAFGRQFNLTTIRYAPNAPAVYNDANWPGVGDNFGSNNPLNSAHTGGVQILLTDGAVRFVSENINMFTLRCLATRDDGNTFGDF